MKSTVLLAIGALGLAACATATTEVADVDAAAPASLEAEVKQAVADGDLPENVAVTEDGEILVPSVPIAGDPDQEICKVRHQTGSRVKGVKTCMTRREWAELRGENARFLDRGYQSTDSVQ